MYSCVTVLISPQETFFSKTQYSVLFFSHRTSQVCFRTNLSRFLQVSEAFLSPQSSSCLLRNITSYGSAQPKVSLTVESAEVKVFNFCTFRSCASCIRELAITSLFEEGPPCLG